MVRPKLEVADIFRHHHGEAWRTANAGHVNLTQRRVMMAIEICRTAALGGHVERCADCAHTLSEMPIAGRGGLAGGAQRHRLTRNADSLSGLQTEPDMSDKTLDLAARAGD